MLFWSSISANTKNHATKKESKKLYDRERYKRMTHGQKEAKRVRERMHNSEPRRKEALKLSDKKCKEKWKHTLYPNSIAMENPLYVPEVVWPTEGASRAHGSTTKPSDWVIPEFSATPLHISLPDKEVGDDIYHDILPARRSHVPSGQRHALLTRRNTMFEHRIGSNTRASNQDGDYMAQEPVDVNTPLPQSVVTNNETVRTNIQATSATPIDPLFDDCETLGEEHMNDNTPFPQLVLTNNERTGPSIQATSAAPTTPLFDDSDSDQGDIFEDDDEEDEGYLFAGQDEEDDDDVQENGLEEDMTDVPEVPDQYEMVYSNMPTETHMLKPVANCQHCNAKRFEHEPPRFCCHSGKVELNEPNIPDEIMRLWSSNDVDARHFRNSIRFFNGHFSFTSLYCRLDSATASVKNTGIYTFHAHGQIYHNIRSFGKEDGKDPRHLELYFYDDDPNLEHRYQ